MPSRLTLLTLVALAALLPSPGRGQSSPWVPLSDGAYADVDALVAAGLLPDVIVMDRPWDRVTFARLAGEARGVLDHRDAAIKPPVQEALARLETRFAPEVAHPCGGDAPCGPGPVGVRLLDAAADVTWADSPGRAIPTAYADASYIDATLNPLLQGEDGRVLVDGLTAGVEAAVEARLGRHLTGVFRPRLRHTRTGDGRATRGVVQEAYLHAVLGNASLDVGRSWAVQAQGRGAGAILSRNARALDRIRLRTARPFRLPWIFGALGPMNASASLSDMGARRDIPHSKLVALHVDARPHPNLELGATLLNHQAGEGAPAATFWQRVQDVFLWGVPGFSLLEISDKVAGMDARLTLPRAGLEAYVEWMATDVQLMRIGEMMGDEGAWVGGLRFPGLGREGRVTPWLEVHRSGVRPHTHHQFTSGLTVDGMVLGDPLGPMGTGLSAGVDVSGRRDAVTLSATWERYRGDRYAGNGKQSGDFRWIRTEDGPDEVRLRAQASWSRNSDVLGLSPSARVGVERVTRFDFGPTDRTNAMAQLRLAWLFR